ncbi:choice-of-anchor D domain-containing protein [Luteolibacter soli]|uniref:Choice-of-anchor D domain-containing protein n=1 Tax=Luteolibacter soli TaxID=3135280 RepID=A0ABU9B3N7_9BACT
MKTLSSIALVTLCLTPGLWAAGELDTTFNPNVNDEIKALALTADGKIFIGGSFTSVGGVETNRIARLLTSGSKDPSWDYKTAGAPASCVVLADGNVLVADPVKSSQTTVYRFLANGTSDQTWKTIDASATGIQSMALDADGNLLVTGGFHALNNTKCAGFAVVGMDGVIKSHPLIEVSDTRAVLTLLPRADRSTLLGGSFVQINSKSRNHVAKISSQGTFDSVFAPAITVGTDSAILCLARRGTDGSFYAGGSFSQTLDGKVIATCLASFSSTGVLNTSFRPIFTHATKAPRVTSLAVQADGKIIVAGDFTGVNGVANNGLVRLLSDGTNDSSFKATAEGVTGLALQMDGRIIITGNFTQVNGVARNRIARLRNSEAFDRLTIRQDVVSWSPFGAIPQCDLLTLETSTDGGVTWLPAGKASPTSGGWLATGLDLPVSGMLRLLGRSSSGLQNGSSGLAARQTSYSLVPEVSVRELNSQGGLLVLTDGQTSPVDYGEIGQGSAATKTLQIYNSGSAKLTVTDIQLPPGFTLINPPVLPAKVGTSTYLALTVQADTTALGSLSGTAVISTDDADEASFDFPLAAAVVGPDIAMHLGDVELPNDRAEPVTFVEGYQGADPVRRSFAISNEGNRNLVVSRIAASAGFTVDDAQAYTFAPGESREIRVGPDQSIAGDLTGYLEVYSDDADEPVFRVPLAARVLNPLVTKVLNTRTTLNRKTGLREQKLRILNPVKIATVDGFRVIVRGLPEGVVVRNASEVLEDGSVVIEVHRPLGPLGKFDFVLEYEISKGTSAVVFPALTTEVILNSTRKAALVSGAALAPEFAVEKCERTADGDFALTFRAVPGRFYQVEYSSDGKIWKASSPTCAAGSIVRWVDCGSPYTESSPKDVPMRLYRVREIE